MVFNKSLQKPWQYAQLGLLLFPLLTPIGSLGLLLALVGTWRQHYKKIIQRPLNWVLAILSGWLVLIGCFAFRPTDAFLGLFNFLPFFGFFAGFSALIQTPAQLRRIAQILVFTSVPVVILGLGQLFWGWATPEAWKGVFGTFGCAIAPGGNPPGRMASVFMYTNLLAGYLVIVFILSLGLWIESFQKLGVRSQKGSEVAEVAEGAEAEQNKGDGRGDKGNSELSHSFVTTRLSPLNRRDISRLYHSPLATHHSPLTPQPLTYCQILIVLSLLLLTKVRSTGLVAIAKTQSLWSVKVRSNFFACTSQILIVRSLLALARVLPSLK